MAYISLYRKYRSQSFGEVIGQSHVTTVLQNAIRMGRVAHAYLFCGPRGCGKTSTARLVARALNCVGVDGSLTGPTAEPCGVCALCTSIREGSAMDVIEMDAASETGIDDVREKIIENAKFAPGEARFKVYIIDEVHDLSLKAFDSLLKTIEEPPAHVVFILATTEAHKVPITIRSRCQRMDFRRGGLQDLIGNITRVLDLEQIGYETEAVTAVARAAEGSFRDSLSLLEQALAYTDGDRLTAEAVHASIGTVGAQLLDDVTRTIASDDMYAAFVKAGELVDSGKDVKQTLIALQAHLRDLLVAGIADSPEALADVSPERFTQLKEESGWFAPAQLLRMLDILAESERSLRFTNQHHRVLEMALWNILPRHVNAVKAVQGAPDPVAAPPRASTPPPAPRPVSMPPSVPVADPIRAEQSSPPPAKAPNAESTETTPWGAEIDLEGMRRVWPRVVKRVLQRSPSAKAIFGGEQVLRLENHVIVVGFPSEFILSRADRPKGREMLESVLAEELGIRGWKIRCVLLDESTSPVPTAPAVEAVPLSMLPEVDAHAASLHNNGFMAGNDSPREAVVSPAAVVPQAGNPEGEQFLKLVLDEFDGQIVED
jgi:DNA polymerase-3 subunit gamma/tau